MDEVQLSLSFSQSARRARESNVLVARQNTTAVFQAVCKYPLQKQWVLSLPGLEGTCPVVYVGSSSRERSLCALLQTWPF